MSACRDCGAEIDWVRTEEGRYIPVDPEPVFVIEGEGDERFYDEELGVITGRPARPEEVQTMEAKSIRRWALFRTGGPAGSGGESVVRWWKWCCWGMPWSSCGQ